MGDSITMTEIFEKISGIPSNIKLILLAALLLFVIYVFLKRKRTKPINIYEKAIGEKLKSSVKELYSLSRQIQDEETKLITADITKTCKTLYKRIIGMENSSVQKIGPQLNESIMRLANQMELTAELIKRYIRAERSEVELAGGSDSKTQNEQIRGTIINGIKQELVIIRLSYIKIYNNIEIALRGKRAKTIDVPAAEKHSSNTVFDEMREIQQIMNSINNNIMADMSGR